MRKILMTGLVLATTFLVTAARADEARVVVSASDRAQVAAAVEARRAQWLEALQAALARQGVAERTAPAAARRGDGAQAANVGSQHMSVTVATIQADGELAVICVDGAQAAARALAATATDGPSR